MRLSVCIWLFLLIFTVSACIVDAFFCNPPRYVYDVDWVSRPDRAEHCLSDDVSYGILVYQGALSFLTDLAIFMLPIPALCRMTVSRGKVSKVFSCMVFRLFYIRMLYCAPPSVPQRVIDTY